MPDDADAVPARREIVEAARQVLRSRLSFIEAAPTIATLRHAARWENDPDVLTFVGVESQTHALAIGSVRALWSADGLARAQPEIDRAERWAERVARPRCKRLAMRNPGA